MKTVILYRPGAETESRVQQYIRDFEHQTSFKLPLVDVNTVDGVELAKLHDILQFPTILVTEDDGTYVQSYTELEKWPTVSELSFYGS